METKHTPGPWIRFTERGETIAILPVGRPGEVAALIDVKEADACLMTAAPDLLEAAMQAECGCSPKERDSGHLLGCWMPTLKAAIAKAVGHDG